MPLTSDPQEFDTSTGTVEVAGVIFDVGEPWVPAGVIITGAGAFWPGGPLVSSHTINPTVTDTSTPYADGDQIGAATALSIPAVGRITRVMVTSATAAAIEGSTLRCYFYGANPSLANDADQNPPLLTDLLGYVDVVGSRGVAQANVAMPYSGTAIYVSVTAHGAALPAAFAASNDLKVTVCAEAGA